MTIQYERGKQILDSVATINTSQLLNVLTEETQRTGKPSPIADGEYEERSGLPSTLWGSHRVKERHENEAEQALIRRMLRGGR